MLNLDEANYGPEVEQAAEPVLIGLCSGGGPLPRGFALLAAEGRPGLKCCRLDVSRCGALAGRLQIKPGGPSLLLVKEGQVAQRFRGDYDRGALLRILDLD